MAERVSGPYRGYYVSVSARLVPARSAASQPAIGEGIYVGAVSVSQRGPDDPHRIETLLELGDERRFATEDDALLHAEQAARDYIDRLLTVA